ncbi:heterogeneous nuclear ribonucleoprotein U-like protein 1 isoform X2 [Zophobas morio]|uniref:heterogeneous nuclear ribonucleoprotein U-like protein 1 isoform X2 n=1 Tax=Zophobas morio TaxID=2755281 RepID=UPI003082AB9E
MSSIVDPAKLKVVELRAELSKRGLDSKGNKPALVKRLKEALKEELKGELPDTSIADTLTEEPDTSQSQDCDIEESKVPDGKTDSLNVENVSEEHGAAFPEVVQPLVTVANSEDNMEAENSTLESMAKEPDAVVIHESEQDIEKSVENQLEEVNFNLDENGDMDESKSRKSRWSSQIDNPDLIKLEENNQIQLTETAGKEQDSDPKVEKRRRSSVSPDRSQRRRSKSPVKEDEPPIDADKVQLSWYDSDLHLQVDKESFLSAKPYHEGAFGFAWAGVRATHGVTAGKICFEVKVTEELKWEDFSKYYDKHRKDQQKSLTKYKHGENKVKDETDSKETDGKDINSKQENGDEEELQNTETEVKEFVEQSAERIKESNELEVSALGECKLETTESEECKEYTDDQQIQSKEQSESLPTHLFRVGWSLLDTGLQLGEDKYSYGYESSGSFVTNKEFQQYGVQFGIGDVITSFLCIDENRISISYAVNGVPQLEAVQIPYSEMPENFALFPHVLSRNYAFELNLGSKEESWFSRPEPYEEYQFLDKVEAKVAGLARPENRSDCEVILMCGLPASGKTHWVREYIQSNPDKRYTVLGNTHFLEKMTVSGDALKTKYKGSWNILLEKLQKSLNKLIEIAALRRRNYIIDQPNVYPSAQRRKLRPFEGFKRRAVVVVVGDEEQAKRQSLQEAEGGKDVPDSTVLDMKANMSLPQKGDWLDEVVYMGVGEEEAKVLVQKYNSQARESIGIQRRFGHRDDRHRWQNRRNDYRGANYRDRNYHHSRYDRAPPRQGNWHPQRPGGWNRDRRDHRGPPMGGSRDWRNRGNTRDRGNRDMHIQGNNYSRSRNQPGRGPAGNWPSNWGQNQGNWSQPWGGQNSWSQGGWSGQNNHNQWKYGGGYSNYSNWNYYGQYTQNWNPQSQTHSAGTTTGANQYGQYSQQDWAQYAQQYAQQGQNSETTQSTPQK